MGGLRSALRILVFLTAIVALVNAQYYGGSSDDSGYGSDSDTTTSAASASTSSPSSASNSGSKSDTPFAAFESTDGSGAKITAALNVPSTGNDLYFHMEASDKNSWMAFGIGSSMSDSPLIFLAYRSSDGNSITVSPRLATQHSEPQHDPVKDVQVTILAGSGISGGNMVMNAKCSNCRSWKGNSINVKSLSQPMILAVYSGDSIQSNDVAYHISQHTTYRQFTMNMVEATGKGGVPVGPFDGTKKQASSGISETDFHTARTIHAVLMLASFLLLYPLGVIYLRVLERVWLHWLNQSFATLAIAIAAAIGIGISIKQKIHPNLLAPHQLIGLIALGLVLVQLTLGFIHHAIYKRTQRPTPLGKIHRFAGPFVVSLGLANGFLGFRFADENRYTLGYIIAIVIVTVILVVSLWMKGRSVRRGGGRRNATKSGGVYGSKGFGVRTSETDIPLTGRRGYGPVSGDEGAGLVPGDARREGPYDPPFRGRA